MATGTPVVASDLEAFRRVLEDGRAGVLVPVRDAGALAGALASLLADEPRRRRLAERGSLAVTAYDWESVTSRIVEVYETVSAAAPAETHVAVDAELDTLAELLAEGDGTDDDTGRLVSTLRRWLAERPRLPDRPRLPERPRLPDRARLNERPPSGRARSSERPRSGRSAERP